MQIQHNHILQFKIKIRTSHNQTQNWNQNGNSEFVSFTCAVVSYSYSWTLMLTVQPCISWNWSFFMISPSGFLVFRTQLPVKNVLLNGTLRKLWQIQPKQKHMTALTRLWLCILGNNFAVQVNLMAASRTIFRPSVFNTLNYLLRIIWVGYIAELQLGYLQLAMLFTTP